MRARIGRSLFDEDLEPVDLSATRRAVYQSEAF